MASQSSVIFDTQCRVSYVFRGQIGRAIHHYVHTYAKISVVRKFCDFSYVLFTISS